jgi:hypothetical protein
MLADKHEVIQGLKNKDITKVNFIINNAMSDGYVGLTVNEKVAAVLGWDGSDYFKASEKEKKR